MFSKLITSFLTLLIVIVSSVSPVRAYDIRAYGFILGGADGSAKHRIPEVVGEVGTFDVKYRIAYMASTTNTVQQVTPDYIYAQWTFDPAIQFSYKTSLEAPVSGDGWCGKRDVRLVCAFPVSKAVGEVYSVFVTYTPTVNCACLVRFETSFSDGSLYQINDAVPIPALKVKTFLPLTLR